MNVVPSSADGRVGAVEPAEQAVDALREVDLRLDAGPPAAGSGARGLSRDDGAAGPQLVPVPQLSHGYPSSTARRTESGGSFLPEQLDRGLLESASGGSPSAAATAPTMTMLAKLEPCSAASRDAGTQTTRVPSSSAGASSAFSEHETVGLEALGHAGLAHERRLEHDDDVRMLDRSRAAGSAGRRPGCRREAAPLGARARTRGTPGRCCPT